MIRFQYLILLLCLGVAPAAWAQVEMTPKYHQFGNIRPGSKNVFKVTLTNKADKPLALSHLRSDCECTNVNIPVNVLKSKQSTTMTITYKPETTDRGWKDIGVKFDLDTLVKGPQIAPSRTVTFLFTANLLPKSYQDPVTLNLGYVVTGIKAEAHSKLYVDPKAYTHWKPGLLNADKPWYTGRVTALPTPGYFDVSIQTTTDVPPGHYKGTVIVNGAAKKDETFTYPYIFNVGSRWDGTGMEVNAPASLNWEKVKNWHPKAVFHLTTKKPFKVFSLSKLAEWLKYDLGKDSDSQWHVEFRVDEGLLKKAKAEQKFWPEVIDIHTDQKIEPTLTLRMNIISEQKTLLPSKAK